MSMSEHAAQRHFCEVLPCAGKDFYLFDTTDGPHLLVVDGSQIFKIDAQLAGQLARIRREDGAASAVLARHGLGLKRFIADEPLADPPIRALSLAVAERCNLGCTYCYAQGGSFGGAPHAMSWKTAEASIQRLFAGVKPGERVNLSFLGGEPLTNRSVIRRATELAAQYASDRDISISFSITTNGTLLTLDDCAFFERYAFSVTVSLDGVGRTHDRLRPTKGGRGSYDRVIANVRPLLVRQRRMQVSARVTVTPANLDLRDTLDHFVELGFHSVGFSPMLSAPTRRGEMQEPELQVLLDNMIACGREFERRIAASETYPFANMMTALEEIHRGTHRPYPCGAGAGYFGVSASGGLFACHRFVDDSARAMGHVSHGVDQERQQRWLEERHVNRQEPCRSCWARYLCGGGCHYEVIHRGRPACDYIRGWLDYALGAYVRLSALRPELFSRDPVRHILKRNGQPCTEPASHSTFENQNDIRGYWP
jgi:uncharacterized protein